MSSVKRGSGSSTTTGGGGGSKLGGRSGRGRGGGGLPSLPRAGADVTRPSERRTPKKKAGGARRTNPKARINKKSGDVRSMPDAGAELGGERTRKGADGPLSGRAIRHLRGLGHHIDPIVQIGKDGITDSVVAATRAALHAHELVKVKVGTESPIDRKEAGPELAELAGAILAQILGRTLLLYKRHPQKPKIELPR